MRTPFDTIAQVAARQHGRITHGQLLDAGLGVDQIKRLRAKGLLRPVHHRVYALGHTAPSFLAGLMAAVLACGSGAAASHLSAGHALALVAARPDRPEVTVPTTAGRRRPGIRIHRVSDLDPRDVTRHIGIPMTIVPRVLLDLAPRLDPNALTRACHQAWVHHGTAPAHVEACIARNPTKKGAGKLRRALGADVTLSMLEDGFIDLLTRFEIPRPRTNIDLDGYKVDCHWPAHGLTVELLGYRFHASRQAWERDVARRRRSNHIAYSYGDIFERADQTAAEVIALLGLQGPSRPAPPRASSARRTGRRGRARGS
ncbi:MAG TPA: hypothetical protein VMY78_05140 [Solirubrobacteraceae bacterium]|nr:hypothetical protein [Solirubrobacteraceae bacterium]